jgi:hypothetical protein
MTSARDPNAEIYQTLCLVKYLNMYKLLEGLLRVAIGFIS